MREISLVSLNSQPFQFCERGSRAHYKLKKEIQVVHLRVFMLSSIYLGDKDKILLP